MFKQFKKAIYAGMAVLLVLLFVVACSNNDTSENQASTTQFDVSAHIGKYDVSFSAYFSTIELRESKLSVDGNSFDFQIIGEQLQASFSNFQISLFIDENDLMCKILDLSTGLSSLVICYPYVETESEIQFDFEPDTEEEIVVEDELQEEEKEDDSQQTEKEVQEENLLLGLWVCEDYYFEIFFDELSLCVNFCGTLAFFEVGEVLTFSVNESQEQTTYTVVVLDDESLKLTWQEFNFELFKFVTMERTFQKQQE